MNTNQNVNSITENQNQNHVQEEVSDVVNTLITSVASNVNNDNNSNNRGAASSSSPTTNLEIQTRINQHENLPIPLPMPGTNHELPQTSLLHKPTFEIYRARDQQLTESFSVIDAATSVAELPTVPPTYSTVMKQDRLHSRDLHLRREFRSMEFQHISPFRRIPPPSYSEIQGTWSRNSGDYMSNNSSEQILFGPEPIFIWCNRCTTVVVSSTTSERSKFTHFTAAALCLFGCWPCAMLPYCMNACKNTYHYCPDCNYLLGTYQPW